MRNANKEELERFTRLTNELAVKKAEVDLAVRQIRLACGAPEGFVVDEITGEWLRPIFQDGRLVGHMRPDGTPWNGQAPAPAPAPKDKFEKRLLRQLNGKKL